MASDKGSITLDYRGNLIGAQYAFAGMSFLIDPADIPIESGLCADICNCDIDYSYNVDRRNGSSLIVSGNITSAWSNNDYAYCVKDTFLSTFNGTTITQIDTTPLGADVEFKQVNDVVVFSDNTLIGVISNGTTVTYINKASDWVDVATVATWVTNHFPADPAKWDGTHSNSNFEVDAFKLATLSGKCLEYFNGVLYLAIDNFIYCTKAFDLAHMDIRYNIVAGFPEAVTMIARVNDGLYVGTEKSLYFLQGTGSQHDEKGNVTSSFKQTHLANYPVLYGTNCRVQADLVPLAKANNTIVLFATTLGIFAGADGGNYTNMSLSQISMPYLPKGTAIFREYKSIYQYIVCFNTADDIILTTPSTSIDTTKLQDTWILNPINGAHSRYTNYIFNSFFKYKDNHYGANNLGIFQLTGDIDYSGVTTLESDIDSFIITPTSDYDKRQKKAIDSFFIHSRAAGELLIDIIVDEDNIIEDIPVRYDNRVGLHRKRAKIPKGVQGTDFRFKIKNIDSSYFNIFNAEVSVKTLKRTV